MRSRRWRSIQSGLPASAHGSPKLVQLAFLAEVDGMRSNTPSGGPVGAAPWPRSGSVPYPSGPYGFRLEKVLGHVSWVVLPHSGGSEHQRS